DLPKLKSLVFGKSVFHDCSRVVFENLPELVSIQLGDDSFLFADDKSSELIMQDLPRLTTLTTKTRLCYTFSKPRFVTLSNIPLLTNITLTSNAFKGNNAVIH
ncbi:hypothetical protein WA577_003672, partial [Blastocystis sp. JDR]